MFLVVIAGLDPAIHDEVQRTLTGLMDHRVTPLRGGPVMTDDG